MPRAAGGVGFARVRRTTVHQVLGVKPDPDGGSEMPPTRMQLVGEG